MCPSRDNPVRAILSRIFQRRPIRVRQNYTGLGAGNIGDEIMARAFWQRLPSRVLLDVYLADESIHQRAPYPQPHRYFPAQALAEDTGGSVPVEAGLIVGTTPVVEAEGPYALLGLADSLRPFAHGGLPVDAIGVGIERLEGAEARELFRTSVRPAIRSWTVRSEACREALLDLDVSPERVRVGADWAWTYIRGTDASAWAAGVWRSLGIDSARPLVAVNVVNLIWANCTEAKNAMAAALDRVIEARDAQVAFFCNEFRPAPWADAAAARDLAARMRRRAILVPVEYYSPDETLALLAHAAVTLGQRYHFVVESVLAGAVPVAIPRLLKMESLVRDLGCPHSGRIDTVNADHLAATLIDALDRREDWLRVLSAARDRLAARAKANFDLIKDLPPYNRVAFLLNE